MLVSAVVTLTQIRIAVVNRKPDTDCLEKANPVNSGHVPLTGEGYTPGLCGRLLRRSHRNRHFNNSLSGETDVQDSVLVHARYSVHRKAGLFREGKSPEAKGIRILPQ